MDYQKVKIVALTKPYNDKLFSSLRSEDIISYCARVSNPNNQNNFETSDKLLSYLMKEEHWSPFEMVNVVMEIETTRDIARQILRHRSFSFQEFSQRYAKVDTDSFVSREARLQDNKNRQNSLSTDSTTIHQIWEYCETMVHHECAKQYNMAIEAGIAKEVARSLLPEGLTISRLYMNGTLRSWIHYCLLRMGNGTQKEHADIARKAWNLLKEEYSFLSTIKLQ